MSLGSDAAVEEETEGIGSVTHSDLRVYAPHELGHDGYPIAWHETVKHLVRELAGHRCIRCGHPYPPGIAKRCRGGEWTPCDAGCTHAGIVSLLNTEPTGPEWIDTELDQGPSAGELVVAGKDVLARYRILTVHHLNGHKTDCRWWNLLALCQRCHLQIQGKVRPHRPYPWEHRPWFRPYAAGFYAAKYLGEDLTREETEARLDELLALGAREDAVERMPL